MHLLVPFAAPLSAAGRAALRDLAAPQLRGLLSRLGEPQLDSGDEWSLSPPHERVLARELGLAHVADGLVPLAALDARRAGLATDGKPAGWAWLTPTHWQLGTEQVSLHDPLSLGLDEAESRAFLATVGELFTSEGFELHYRSPHTWLCGHDLLAELPTASLDRAIGRNVDRWLDADPRARLVRRLQNEVQMLLHDHPLNAAREARGAMPVNSVWISGTGRVPPRDLPPDLVLDDRLRVPALREDWPAWLEAWAGLDAGPIATWATRHGASPQTRLTLCGERAAVSWTGAGTSAAARVLRVLSALRGAPALAAALEPL